MEHFNLWQKIFLCASMLSVFLSAWLHGEKCKLEEKVKELEKKIATSKYLDDHRAE